MQIDRVRIALLPVVGLPNLYCVIWNSADTQDDHSFPYTPFCPLPFLFLLFIYFQFHHLPHLFPPMFIMCLAVCVLLLLIISLLSFRLCILTSITTFRSIACFGNRLVRLLAPESKNPATPTSSQSFSYYIVAIVDLFVCFVLFTLALKSTWVYTWRSRYTQSQHAVHYKRLGRWLRGWMCSYCCANCGETI